MKFTLTKSKRKKRFSWNPIHPRRDWQRLLMIFIALTLVVVGWSSYLFYAAEHQEESAATQLVVNPNRTTEQLERIDSYFESRR
jgi:hypothetical protein